MFLSRMLKCLTFPFSYCPCVCIKGDRDDDDRGFLNLFHLLHAQANFHKEVLYLTMNAISS